MNTFFKKCMEYGDGILINTLSLEREVMYFLVLILRADILESNVIIRKRFYKSPKFPFTHQELSLTDSKQGVLL